MPTINPNFPIYGGSTGGWLQAAMFEEKYFMTWTAPSSLVFEMPIGGAAIMRPGKNEFIFARKEQCLALGTQLRTFKINDYKIYRVFPNEEVQFLHPADGVFPEKSNEGRIKTNTVNRSIGKNISPAQINTKEILLKTQGITTNR
jgi:photosystem I subunit 2